MAALLTTREETLQHCPSCRDSVETGSVKADLHFALYCTPYYGYTPQSEANFVAMTFTLADFLVYTCFTTDSEPNAALSNLSVRPGDLLTILSTIHPTFLGPHACAYFNSSQLPLPYFRRTADLQAHTNTRVYGVDFGGYGAKQYHFVYSPRHS